MKIIIIGLFLALSFIFCLNLDAQEVSSKAHPTAHINLTTENNPTNVQDNSIIVYYQIEDKDQAIINSPTINIYQKNQEEHIPIQSYNANVGEHKATFNHLTAGSDYVGEINAEYYLNNDGLADNTNPFLLDQTTFTTSLTTTPDDYNAITTCKDLESIGQGENYPGSTHNEAWSMEENYILMNDIDCSPTNPNNIDHNTSLTTTYSDEGFNPIGNLDGETISYSGHFDGNNHQIQNLYIDL